MHELHGVIRFDSISLDKFKRIALLFDKLHLVGAEGPFLDLPEFHQLNAEITFLEAAGLFERPSMFFMNESIKEALSTHEQKQLEFASTISPRRDSPADYPFSPKQTEDGLLASAILSDIISRRVALALAQKRAFDVVPVCMTNLPTELRGPDTNSHPMHNVLKVAFESFPVPDDGCSWRDIADFKLEMREEQWGFRRFLYDLGTKSQSEAEIRDGIQWSINKYQRAMEKRSMKIVRSALTAIVIPAIDIFSNSGNHLISLVSGVLAIDKLRLELLEGEANVPGRECAYVFDARKRFGQ